MHTSWIEIDLQALQHNVEMIQRAFPAGVEQVLVVKADAYGHGVSRVAQAAYEAGARWFAVVNMSEALCIRKNLPDAHVVILGVCSPEDVMTLHEKRLTPIVANLAHGLVLAEKARALGITLSVHLKVDTGMGRLGVLAEEVPSALATLVDAGGLEFTGICSHFAKVEPADTLSADGQAQLFAEAADCMEKELGREVFKYLSSSRAAFLFQQWDFDGVRPGIVLYGYGTSAEDGRFKTTPVLQWKTRVAQVKRLPAGYPIGYYGTHVTKQQTYLATIAVGYADGYNRALSNKGEVLICGNRYPVVGRVSMNWVTVELGAETDVQVGDEVVLLGKQGDDAIWANELAKICRTIPYEILTSINPLLERRYLG